MRIIIDLHDVQTEGLPGKMGQHQLALTQAIVRNRGSHELVLALNGIFSDSIEPIRGAFDGLIHQLNIRVWYAPCRTWTVDLPDSPKKKISEILQKFFLYSLLPDVIQTTGQWGSHWESTSAIGTESQRLDEFARLVIADWETTAKKSGHPHSSGHTPFAGQLIEAVTPYLEFLDEQELEQLAMCMARNEASSLRRQCLVDITSFCDSQTASKQALSKASSFLRHLLHQPCHPYDIRLVYEHSPQDFRYARRLTLSLHDDLKTSVIDPPMHWQKGDVFLSLDTTHTARDASHTRTEQLRRDGVIIKNLSVNGGDRPALDWYAAAGRLLIDLKNQPVSRQLLVDISELVKYDARSGIQRVVRSILRQWMTAPPTGYTVEAIYASATEPYRYARRYTASFMGEPLGEEFDDYVEVAPGDIFVSLDLQHQVPPAQKDLLHQWRAVGVTIWSVVYDLLPLQLPDCFLPEVHDYHQTWLSAITEFDGAVCISKAVANDLQVWLEGHPSTRYRPFAVKWFHLGADMDASAPTVGLPPDGARILESIRSRPSFLMVSTVEPRKEHEQVLNAFEQLWACDSDVNLVIVGKQGWRVDSLVHRLRNHPQAGTRLLWLEGVSDEYLETIYGACTCLIVASRGEGFGLPLIEAAQHRLPIIARDLPVLHEVAGEHAFYFNGYNAEDLALAVQHWMKLRDDGLHPPSERMPWLTWKESADQLLRIVLPHHPVQPGTNP